jgi:quinol monooxygenase YgiN
LAPPRIFQVTLRPSSLKKPSCNASTKAQALADEGNVLHIYDFRVKPGCGNEFIQLFNENDFSEDNPMHKAAAQVKDGVLCRDASDPDRFYLIGEWKSIEAHKACLQQIFAGPRPKFFDLLEAGRMVPPAYANVVSSTPPEYLARYHRDT